VASQTCDDVLRSALGRRFTAAVLRVERGGRLVFERAYGTLTDDVAAAPAEVTTSFDIASLTKIYVATAALSAVAEARLALDVPVTGAFPEWRGNPHEPITLRMLLAHTSGMQSGADYRTLLAENVERFAIECALSDAPNARVIYSDLGFIALGVLLARTYGRSLALVFSALAKRLGLEATAYRPRNDRSEAIPATECDAWRGRVRGAVHDEKAYLMGGVAGHAGLFGTARDVALLTDAYLAPLCGRGERMLPGPLAHEATVEHGADAVLRRGLGWALKTSDENSCGALMSGRTFGHTGFTGTCVWADPERDLNVVLLTNAVYFGRFDLRDVRAAVNDAAVREFA
jgi:CubicO group peptidase (beta-lactamase class C family)